jgi:phytoene dehydrogenase-like protein
MGNQYDAIIIGGGHNGLTTAAYLAKSGKKVLVLERRHVLGGCTVTEEIYPGFKYTVLSYVVSLMRPEIIRDLELSKHGYHVIPVDSNFVPLPDGNHLFLAEDDEENRRQISRLSRRDADAYSKYHKFMVNLARFANPFLSMVPPDPLSSRPRELLKLLRLGMRFRGLGKDAYSFVKLMTMSSLELAEMFFESDVMKAQVSCSGVIGTFQGIRSPGTAYVLLHHYMGELDGESGEWGFLRGGMGALADALAGAARKFGAEIRTEAPVSKILVRDGAASGVVLESGEEIPSKSVASGVDPPLTFLKMLDPADVPPEFLEKIRQYKARGCSGMVNLALDGLPNFTALPGDGPHLRGFITIAPSTDYLERAYDDAKYGKYSHRPYLDVVIPSLADPSMAPPGKHVMSASVRYAPYQLKAGHWNDHREAFGDNVIDTLCEYAPNLRDIILHRQVLSPWDYEQEFGLTGGNIFHGDLSVDQLFMMRPVPGWAQYRMPVNRLYMCGSGAHPGGGVMGAPGWLAALEMLKDFGNGRL